MVGKEQEIIKIEMKTQTQILLLVILYYNFLIILLNAFYQNKEMNY